MHHSLRILLVSPVFSGGGAERCARELFERLPGRGMQTSMCVAKRSGNDPRGVRTVRFPGERFLRPLDWIFDHADWRHWGSIRRLGRLKQGAFDLVHLHNIHGNWVSLRALNRLCRRLPVVWTLHDEWAATGGIPYDLTRVLPLEEAKQHAASAGRSLACYPTPSTARLGRFLGRHMPQPAGLVSPSRYILNLTRQSGRFNGCRMEHVPYGLALLEEPAIHLDRNDARGRFGIPKDERVVLMIAAQLTSPYKGISLGIEALQQVAGNLSATSPLHVLVLGRDTQRISHSLGDALTVHSAYAADPTTLATAYRAADVTLVPSLADNFPYVAIESFACSTPVVAFRIGGLPEIIGENERGVVVSPFDTSELAAAIATFLSDVNLRDTIGRRANTWVNQTCGMATYLERITGIYHSVIDSFQPA